jgi:hypothetical protein
MRDTLECSKLTRFWLEEEEEEHRQLRRNEHPKTKEGCKKFSGKQAFGWCFL